MSEFYLWFTTGLQHILDRKGYDHILYIIALSIIYEKNHWKQLLWLVTAFTLGHSLTLALSVLNIVKIHQPLVEIWIACTILISCIINLVDLNKDNTNFKIRYLTATVFGCVHGLGFSFLLKSLLGHQQTVIFPLLSFNLGLEAGQLIILSMVIFARFLMNYFYPEKQKIFTTTITFVILLFSIYMVFQRI